MKAILFVLGSILFESAISTPALDHATHADTRNIISDKNRVLINGNMGDDDNGDMGGLGGGDDVDDAGGGGYRALRGLREDPDKDDHDMNDNDEVVVAGRTVVRGGAVVARPRGRWY